MNKELYVNLAKKNFDNNSIVFQVLAERLAGY